jgi:hypothetical protein
MSQTTWDKEFLPITADLVSKKDAGEHVERKWRGLDKETLSQHNLFKHPNSRVIYNEFRRSTFIVNANSCVWCQIAKHEYTGETNCAKCPAVIAGMPRCCDDSTMFKGRSPWMSWFCTGSTTKMLKWIRKARRLIKKQEG